jgi:hypothetical protein
MIPLSSSNAVNIRSVFLALLLAGGVVTMPKATAFFGIDSNSSLINLNNSLGATTFYNAGVFGQNTTSWVVDAQLVGTNLFPAENFSNLADTYAASDVLTNSGDHATWVAALLGGYTPPGYYLNTGIAPGTRIASAALATATNADGSFSISSNSLTAYNYAATHGDVLSTSIGDSSDLSGIGTLSGLLDSLAVANPNTTIVAAAGNSGPTVGSVGGPASGYNSISVGALASPTNYNVVASFSSVSPQPTAWYDGTNTFLYKNGAATRPGVDLVAPGTNIVLPATITTNGNNLSFTYYSLAGTSFATPLVAGGAALLDSLAKSATSLAGITNAATQSVVVKAVLMNSADKLPGWNNGQQIQQGVITTMQALDWAMGAGRMNLNAAFTQYTTAAYVTTSSGLSYSGFNLSVASTGWGYGTALLGGVNDYTLAHELFAGQQIAVTLDWLRDRSWSSSLGDYVDLAQAELDLMIYQLMPGGADQLVAESISPVSTTQELYFQLTASGNYEIKVGYSTNLFELSGSYASQNYGIAWNVSSIPEPRSIVLFLSGAVIVLVRLRFHRIRKPATKDS